MRVNRSIQDTARTRETCGGFSLVELLAVMTIVAMLSTLAVTSYFSAIRGMGFRTASENFYNALMTARQRACIDGCRVSVMIFNEAADFDPTTGQVKDLAASFVVCRELGRLSFVSGNKLFDEFSDLGTLFASGSSQTSSDGSAGAVKLYNLTQGTWSLISPGLTQEEVVGGGGIRLLYSNTDFSIRAPALVKLTGSGTASTGSGSGSWETGDSYGVEVSPVKALPKGFVFSELNNSLTSDQALTDVESVTFEPDGTALKSETFTIKSQSTGADAQSATFTIGQSGEITVSN